MATYDLVGVEEAARLAGVTLSAIHKAHSRGTMPPPIPVAGTDLLVWHRVDIQRWVKDRRAPGRPRS